MSRIAFNLKKTRINHWVCYYEFSLQKFWLFSTNIAIIQKIKNKNFIYLFIFCSTKDDINRIN